MIRDPRRPTTKGVVKAGQRQGTGRRLPPPAKSNSGMMIGIVVGGLIVVGVIVAIVATSKSSPSVPRGPVVPANPNNTGSGPQLTPEDNALLRQAFNNEAEAKKIYSTYISGQGSLTISGPKDAAMADLEKGLSLAEQASQTLESLGNKYNTPLGEGKDLARMLQGFHSALRELRRK